MLADVPIRWIFLCTVVLAPLTEELLFRKLLLDRLYFMNGAVAVFASGFSFGLIHGNFSQFFYAFFLGCLLAVLYRRTGRLSYCVGLHAFVNCIGAFIPLLLRSMIQEPARSLLAGNAPLKSFHLLTSWQRFFVLLQVLFSGTAGKIQPNLPHRYNRIAVEKLCILLKKYKREKRDSKTRRKTTFHKNA